MRYTVSGLSTQSGPVLKGLAIATATALIVVLGVWIREAPDPSDQAEPPGNKQPGSGVLPAERQISVDVVPLSAAGAPDLPEFDPYLSLSSAQAGDTLRLYVPAEQRAVQAVVHATEATPAGNAVIKGLIKDAGRDYRFLFTVGRLQTFGTFQTGFDTYLLEIRGDRVEIAALSGVRRNRTLPERDYVITERQVPESGPIPVPEQLEPEQSVPEQSVPEQSVPEERPGQPKQNSSRENEENSS